MIKKELEKLNGLFKAKAQEMYNRGIKRGSFRWIWENTDYLLDVTEEYKLDKLLLIKTFKEFIVGVAVQFVRKFRKKK